MDRNETIQSIVYTIHGYRHGEIPPPDFAHVEKWIGQFDGNVQDDILVELSFVLSKTYIPRETFFNQLFRVIRNSTPKGKDPSAFWKDICFLDIESLGSSQKEILQELDGYFVEHFGCKVKRGSDGAESYCYIDDTINSGGRIYHDLVPWVKNHAPNSCKLMVVTHSAYSFGSFQARNSIWKATEETNKRIPVKFYSHLEVENRLAKREVSDVLWPVSLPDSQLTSEFLSSLKGEPIFRQPGNTGTLGFFRSEKGRNLLEQEFSIMGMEIRKQCSYLNKYQLPLGNSRFLNSLGFGSLLVTYRNCANNCPLVFWVTPPGGIPLFNRRIN